MVLPDGTEALVEDIDFEVEGKEPELVMKLGDGTIMRAKLVPTKILRMDRYNPDGEPQYRRCKHCGVTEKLESNWVKR